MCIRDSKKIRFSSMFFASIFFPFCLFVFVLFLFLIFLFVLFLLSFLIRITIIKMKLNDPSSGNKFKEGQGQINWLFTVAVEG